MQQLTEDSWNMKFSTDVCLASELLFYFTFIIIIYFFYSHRGAKRTFHKLSIQDVVESALVHTCNPSFWEAEAGGSQVSGWSVQHRPYLKKYCISLIVLSQTVPFL